MVYFCFRSFFESFQLSSHFAHPNGFFCYILFVPLFYSKIVLFPCNLVDGLCWCIHPPLAIGIFVVLVVLECFVLFVLFYPLSISFKPSLLLVYFLELYCLFYLLSRFFSFCPNMFLHSPSVLSFLLVVVDFLFAFPVEFPIQVLSFCSFSLRELRFCHTLIFVCVRCHISYSVKRLWIDCIDLRPKRQYFYTVNNMKELFEHVKVDKILAFLKAVSLYHHHHHHVVPPARISLTLSRHFSLSFISSGRSSGLHPLSSHSCCM